VAVYGRDLTAPAITQIGTLRYLPCFTVTAMPAIVAIAVRGAPVVFAAAK